MSRAGTSNRLDLLGQLWLREPDVELVERSVRELELTQSEPGDLAEAYARVLVLSVLPYGSAFTDDGGELNSGEARYVARKFEQHSFAPAELSTVAGQDHVGLVLRFLAQQSVTEDPDRAKFLARFAAWLPACCMAITREPAVHPFYRELAERTLDAVMVLLRQYDPLQIMLVQAEQSEAGAEAGDDRGQTVAGAALRGPERSLREIVQFMLVPARCGVFLSRMRFGRIARDLELQLPFGSRYNVAENLFSSAGLAERVDDLLKLLEGEVHWWHGEYNRIVADHPAWAQLSHGWLARTRGTLDGIAYMRATAAGKTHA